MPANSKNAATPHGKPIQSKDIPISDPLGVVSVYANDFGLALTNTDMRIIFAELGANLTNNVPTKILKANIVVPLSGAEALARQMLSSIELHKKTLEAMQNAQQPAKA